MTHNFWHTVSGRIKSIVIIVLKLTIGSCILSTVYNSHLWLKPWSHLLILIITLILLLMPTKKIYLENGDNFWMLMTQFRSWWHHFYVGTRCFCKSIVVVGDQMDTAAASRNQHLKIVTNSFCLKYPTPVISDTNIEQPSQLRNATFWKCNSNHLLTIQHIFM